MNAADDRLYWDRYAALYDEGADYVVGRDLRLAVAGRLSREHNLGEVLECGCGTGFYTRQIAPHARFVRATDVSERMLSAARGRLKDFDNVLVEKADAAGLPFVSESFDTILLANIINTIFDPLGVLSECRRVLRSVGLLIVIVYTDYGMEGRQKADLGLRYFQKFGMPPPWGLRNFGPCELQDLLGHARFAVRSVAAIGANPSALYVRSNKAATATETTCKR